MCASEGRVGRTARGAGGRLPRGGPDMIQRDLLPTTQQYETMGQQLIAGRRFAGAPLRIDWNGAKYAGSLTGNETKSEG
jgi:hypothetical protein